MSWQRRGLDEHRLATGFIVAVVIALGGSVFLGAAVVVLHFVAKFW